jgi:hypothetical protein
MALVTSSTATHLPKALLPNTVIIEVRASAYEFWRNTNFQIYNV